MFVQTKDFDFAEHQQWQSKNYSFSTSMDFHQTKKYFTKKSFTAPSHKKQSSKKSRFSFILEVKIQIRNSVPLINYAAKRAEYLHCRKKNEVNRRLRATQPDGAGRDGMWPWRPPASGAAATAMTARHVRAQPTETPISLTS